MTPILSQSIFDYFDQCLSDEAAATLIAVLHTDREARREFVRTAQLHRQLYDSLRASAVPSQLPVEEALPQRTKETSSRAEIPAADTDAPTLADAPTPVAFSTPVTARRLHFGFKALTASIALVSLGVYGWFGLLVWNIKPEVRLEEARGLRHEARTEQEQAAGERQEAGGEQVATITGSEDAQWLAEDASASNQKSEIRNQKSEILPGKPLSLASGTVELKLKQGVRLLVEGPARWSVVDDNRVRLDAGKLVATVPHQAIGFTIKTPTAEIVDLGTEFGVEVDERGNTATQVFVGKTQIGFMEAGDSRPHEAITLHAGQTAHVGIHGKVSLGGSVATGPEQFLKANARPDPQAAPRASSDALAKDEPSPFTRRVELTGPVAYWNFSQAQNETTLSQDLIGGYRFDLFQPHRANNFGLVADKGFPGMGPNNIGLSMQAGNHGVRIDCATSQLDISTDHYSMQIWFSATQPFKSQPNHCLAARANGTRADVDMRDAVMLMGTHDQKYTGRLVYFDGDYHPTRFTAGETPLNLGQWYHVVFVRNGDQIALYLNGDLECEAARPWLGGEGKLISFGQRPNFVHYIGFVGQFDEVALWNRALTAVEVRELYQSAVAETHDRGGPRVMYAGSFGNR